MAEEQTTQAVTTGAAQAAAAEGAQTAATTTPTQEVEDVQALPAWARKIIDDLRKENAGHRTAKTKAEQAAAKAAEAAAAEQGKFKDLYEQAAPRAKQAEAYEAYFAERLDAELKAVPDRLKPLIPDLAPLAKLRWLETARAAGVLAAPAPAQTDARDNPQTQQRAATQLSPERKQELAAIYGVKAEYIPG